jgi:hypothetical protein
VSGYPEVDRARAVRLGLLTLLVLATGTLLASRERARGAAWLRLDLPVAPGATERVESRSRLFGWRALGYTTPTPAAGVRGFYRQELARTGWQPGPGDTWRRARLRLALRLGRVESGATRVDLLLTAVGH